MITVANLQHSNQNPSTKELCVGVVYFARVTTDLHLAPTVITSTGAQQSRAQAQTSLEGFEPW